MKASRIIYKRNFPIGPQFLFESVEVEVSVGPNETEHEVIRYAKDVVEDWHKKHYPTQLATDYFTGKAAEVQVDKSEDEKKILKKITASIEKLPNAGSAKDWVAKNYPDYSDHITVKTLIKLKPLG